MKTTYQIYKIQNGKETLAGITMYRTNAKIFFNYLKDTYAKNDKVSFHLREIEND